MSWAAFCWSIVYPLVTGGLLLSALYYRLRGIRL